MDSARSLAHRGDAAGESPNHRFRVAAVEDDFCPFAEHRGDREFTRGQKQVRDDPHSPRNFLGCTAAPRLEYTPFEALARKHYVVRRYLLECHMQSRVVVNRR